MVAMLRALAAVQQFEASPIGLRPGPCYRFCSAAYMVNAIEIIVKVRLQNQWPAVGSRLHHQADTAQGTYLCGWLGQARAHAVDYVVVNPWKRHFCSTLNSITHTHGLAAQLPPPLIDSHDTV